MSTVHVSPPALRPSTRVLSILQWLGFLAVPLTWAAQHVVGYGAAEARCSIAGMHWGIGLHTWDAAMLGCAAAIALGAEAAALTVFLRDARRRVRRRAARAARQPGRGATRPAPLLLGGGARHEPALPHHRRARHLRDPRRHPVQAVVTRTLALLACAAPPRRSSCGPAAAAAPGGLVKQGDHLYGALLPLVPRPERPRLDADGRPDDRRRAGPRPGRRAGGRPLADRRRRARRRLLPAHRLHAASASSGCSRAAAGRRSRTSRSGRSSPTSRRSGKARRSRPRTRSGATSPTASTSSPTTAPAATRSSPAAAT